MSNWSMKGRREASLGLSVLMERGLSARVAQSVAKPLDHERSEAMKQATEQDHRSEEIMRRVAGDSLG
ncbi:MULTISPECIES: hypothetical protein [unclassified Rhizobium]|uniref:hypothetical protein n=2 Tax=Rhizobium TaxID=379 RepID=UPI00131A4D33|nr:MULTISPECIES: hypothetical protein [Rhizobium]UWU22488.1 hypothetical protein N2601_05865 [Rhizobium tropici]